MKNNIGYYWERLYPYIIGIIVSIFCFKIKFDITTNSNFEDLLGGLVTLSSIIIGFLGAILPTVLGMRDESAFVKYVFGNDKEKLFSKYLKATISLGLIDVLVSLLMYVRDNFSEKIGAFIYYLWVFMTISFIIATYRSMTNMVSLLFAEDHEEIDGSEEEKLDQTRIQEIKNKYKM